MPSFSDTAGREWIIKLDAATLSRVKDRTGYDLLSIVTPEGQKRIEDPSLLLNIFSALCEPQAISRGVNAEQFKAVLGGEGTCDAATNALLEAFTSQLTPIIQRRARAMMQITKGFACPL